MFDRTTDHARCVIVKSQEVSRSLNHEHVRTEHLLLGLLQVSGCSAARALANLSITEPLVRDKLLRIIRMGSAPSPSPIPFSGPAKDIIVSALNDAVRREDDHVGTEHILRALLEDERGLPTQIISEPPQSPPDVQRRVLHELDAL